ncbi:GNAT family N-acetyltransferase [Ruminococcaceae bacterium OttesenSCG-928-L11]|nr:GNAT family N-acetyltransferase [Ruminococcaceae bacterium OttesenSCG-928-L11]
MKQEATYTVQIGKPSVDQWMSLRASVGWASFSEEVAQKSLDATPFCVCAMDGDELIGMGRVLGDGVFSFYIGNVMVRPDRQSEGVGRAIMEEIMAYVDANAVPGAIASLMSIKGKEEFYTRFGFVCRPDETHGSGMSRYY